MSTPPKLWSNNKDDNSFASVRDVEGNTSNVKHFLVYVVDTYNTYMYYIYSTFCS